MNCFRNKTWRITAVLILATSLNFAAFCRAFSAQTYQVSPTGNDLFPGTETMPFRQIRKALTLVSAGDTVLVADGNYLGFDVDSLNGSPTAPVTIRARGTNALILPTTDRFDNRDTIYVLDSTYLIIDGLRSYNANRAALRIQDGHHITIRNCVFGNNARWGILTGHSPDLLIENNECFGSVAEHGIYVANSGDRPVVRGNRCYNNFGGGIQLNADVNTPPGDGIITGALLENNILYNNGAGGGGALNLDGIQDSIVRNNLIFGNHASGIIFFQIDGAEGPRGNQILHNTIDMAADGRWALGIMQTTGTNLVQNNILFNRHSFRGGLQFGSSIDAANTDTDYNVMNHVTTDDGNSRLTLLQWQSQGHDLHSITGSLSTLFLDAAVGNYFLAAASLARDRAISFGPVNFDLEGNPRPSSTASDLGCYEMASLTMQLTRDRFGALEVRFKGGAGKIYRLEASQTFSNWTEVNSLIRSNRPLNVAITNSSNQTFYRGNYSP